MCPLYWDTRGRTLCGQGWRARVWSPDSPAKSLWPPRAHSGTSHSESITGDKGGASVPRGRGSRQQGCHLGLIHTKRAIPTFGQRLCSRRPVGCQTKRVRQQSPGSWEMSCTWQRWRWPRRAGEDLYHPAMLRGSLDKWVLHCTEQNGQNNHYGIPNNSSSNVGENLINNKWAKLLVMTFMIWNGLKLIHL